MKPHLIVLGLLGAVVLGLFAPALSGRASFAFRDAAHFYYPLFEYIRGQWGAGRLPLWNPYENCGVPLLAENTSSVFYPGKLLFALPLDYALLYNWYIVAHVALAAATSYRLARYWGGSRPAAGAGALAYAFSGSVLFQYCNVVFLVGAAWLPLALQLAERMLSNASPRAAMGMGLVLAMMITGGDPQMAYNAGLLAVVRALMLGQAAAGAQERLRAFARGLPLLAVAASVAALVAAVQILPTVEASRHSARGHYESPRNIYELAGYLVDRPENGDGTWYDGFLGRDPRGHQRQIYQFSLEPWRLAELVWPNVTGRSMPTEGRWLAALGAEGNLWTPSLYLGLLPLVLALATWSLRRSAPEAVRWCSWMVLFGVLGSFGAFGLAWLVGLIFGGSELYGVGGEVGGFDWWLITLVPNYVYFRYPAKLFVVASLGLSMLGARGWDRAWQDDRVGLRRGLALLAVVSAACFCGALAARGALVHLSERSEPTRLMGPFDAVGAWHDILTAAAQTALLSALFCVLLRARPADSRWRSWAPPAALALTALDLAFAQTDLILYAPSEYWRREPAIVRELPVPGAGYRVYRELGPLPRAWSETASADRYTECLIWDRETLWPKYPLPYEVSLVEASGTMIPREYELLLEVARKHGAQQRIAQLDDHAALDLLGAEVAIVANGKQDAGAGWPAMYPRPAAERPPVASPPRETLPLPEAAVDMIAVVRPSALPRAWIVHEVEQLGESQARGDRALKKLTERVLFPDGQPRDWRRVATVESATPLSPAIEPAAAGPAEICRLVRAEPSEVAIEVHLNSAGLVILSDLYFPGWELSEEVSGISTEIPIVRTNRVLRGAALSAGDHHLVFRYRPASFRLGAALSALSLAGLGVFAVLGALRCWARSGRARVAGPV